MISPKRHCNSRVKESCPLNGDYLQFSVADGCKIIPQRINHITLYWPYGNKDKLYKHKNSFKYETKKNSTDFQTTYMTFRKIDNRCHLSDT